VQVSIFAPERRHVQRQQLRGHGLVDADDLLEPAQLLRRGCRRRGAPRSTDLKGRLQERAQLVQGDEERDNCLARELQRLEGQVRDYVALADEQIDQRRENAGRKRGERRAGDGVELEDCQRCEGYVAPLFSTRQRFRRMSTPRYMQGKTHVATPFEEAEKAHY